MTASVHSHVDHGERQAVVTTRFDHPIDTVWTLWSDPAKLARWWGPAGMPMTVDHHDLHVGGAVAVTVETPGGAIRGRWSIQEVEPPHRLRFTFASDGLEPTEISVRLTEESAASTAMTLTIRFSSEATMQHALEIGFDAGVALSVERSHRVLAGDGPEGATASMG